MKTVGILLIALLGLVMLVPSRVAQASGCLTSFREVVDRLESGAAIPGEDFLSAYDLILDAALAEASIDGEDLHRLQGDPFTLAEGPQPGRFQYRDAMLLLREAFLRLGEKERAHFERESPARLRALAQKHLEKFSLDRKTGRSRAKAREHRLDVLARFTQTSGRDSGVSIGYAMPPIDLAPAASHVAIDGRLYRVSDSQRVDLVMEDGLRAKTHHFSRDGARLVSVLGGRDAARIVTYDIVGGSLGEAWPVATEINRAGAIAISPTADLLAYATNTQMPEIKYYDLSSRSPSAKVQSARSPVTQLHFPSTGPDLLGVAARQGPVRWTDERPQATGLGNGSRRAEKIVDNPSRDVILSATRDGDVLIMDRTSGAHLGTHKVYETDDGAHRDSWSFSADGRLLAIAEPFTEPPEVRLFSMRDGVQLFRYTLPGASSRIGSIHLSANGGHLAISYLDAGNRGDTAEWTVQVWDLRAFTEGE